jgi:hypothetical protein
MNSTNLNVVPLQQASLCLDCETITAALASCHVCGSRALLNLARALDQPNQRSYFRPSNPVLPAIPRNQLPRGNDFAQST